MKITVFMRSGDADAGYYLQALGKACETSSIDVFRDSSSIALNGVTYITTSLFRKGILKFLERFFQALLEVKPDVYIGVYEIPHGLYAFILSVLFRRKFVLSIIGNPGYTTVRKGLFLRVTKLMMAHADAITVTGSSSKSIIEEMGFDVNKVFILPNTIPVESFRAINKANRHYDLISLGRISPEKHVETIIYVVERLKKEGMSLKLAIAGSGDELESIRSLVDRSGLRDSIELLGYIPDSELESFFNNGKVFILCSETEGFPRTILQAASCGAAIVSSAVGDIPDIINNGENGFLVTPYDNLDLYCDCVKTALKNTEQTRSMVNQLLKKIQMMFSFNAGSIVWKEIFEKTNHRG
jgi:glycosyltransferase involved in cell wall biosynthesis